MVAAGFVSRRLLILVDDSLLADYLLIPGTGKASLI